MIANLKPTEEMGMWWNPDFLPTLDELEVWHGAEVQPQVRYGTFCEWQEALEAELGLEEIASTSKGPSEPANTVGGASFSPLRGRSATPRLIPPDDGRSDLRSVAWSTVESRASLCLSAVNWRKRSRLGQCPCVRSVSLPG